MIRIFLFVGCALLILSCNNSATNIVLSSLERSERIDLFCADVEQLTGNLFEFRQVLPLELCNEDVDFAEGVNASFLGSVTQTESGTLAVVNFTNNAIFDTNRTVPGVTALTVGEQPTAVQVSSVDSRYTYVTSFSAKSVQAVSTREVITGDPGGSPPLPRQEIRFDAGPQDLALYEMAEFEPITQTNNDGDEVVSGATTMVDFRFLYVAVPELGQIFEIPVDVNDETGEQTLGTPVPFDLPTVDCNSDVVLERQMLEPPPSDESDYNRICPESFEDRQGRFIKTVQTTVPCEDGPAPGPSPVRLAIDAGRPGDESDDVLLVADANQPVIHRFSLSNGGATELDPIISFTPTIDVTATPFVPASSDPDDRQATQRYIYAITGSDGSILAIDDSDPNDEETFGFVLPVLAGVNARATEEGVEARNRVRSGFANARAIEVITPFYEVVVDEETGDLVIPENDEGTDICDPDNDEEFALAQNVRNFRGVFLAVSLSSGQMFYLDIYDLNAPCRGGEGAIACTLAETGPDQFASIRRHRRRFGFTPTTFIDIDGQPSFQFNEAPGVINATTGEAQASDGPDLEFIDCPTSQFSVFGLPTPDATGESLICSSSQVWSTFTQRWDTLWQGPIPLSRGGLGLFSDESFDGEPGNWFLGGDVPFCEVGVLGEQDGTAIDSGLSIDQLPAYGGDRLVIVGELPISTRDDEDCKRVFEDLEEDLDERQIWFPIIRAFNDQLEIGPSPNPDRYTLEETARCFNQFTEYQVNTLNVYAVTGSDSDFIHRVVPSEDTGECEFDESRPVVLEDVDTFLTARAFPGTQFINPLVSFQISETDVVFTDSTIALLSFNILNQFGFELLDTGGNQRSLPGSMLFAPESDQLLFVDFNAGVRRIVFNPLNIIQTFD
jgi:hypothetical protein